MNSIPGGPERALSAATRLKYLTVVGIVGGCAAALVALLRSLRGGGNLPIWTTPWATWLLGIKR